MNRLVSKLPIDALQMYNQITSADGLTYFIQEPFRYQKIQDLNMIDVNFRVLADFLHSQDAKVHIVHFKNAANKQQVDDAYDNYKRSEKKIKEEGLDLYYLDGTKISVQNDKYRFDYQSHKAFSIKYPIDTELAYLNFILEDDDKVNLLKNNIGKFENSLTASEEGSKTKFILQYKNNYKPLAVSMIRMYTQTLVKLLKTE